MRGPTLLIVRRLHLYLSVFFAPLLLLFVVTGWAQTMDFDHATPWLSRLSQVHVHQTFSLPQRKGGGGLFAEGRRRGGQGGEGDGGGGMNRPMKWLIAAMSVALIISISLGLVLAFTMVRNRVPVWIALLLGIAVPVSLLALEQPPADRRVLEEQPAAATSNSR